MSIANDPSSSVPPPSFAPTPVQPPVTALAVPQPLAVAQPADAAIRWRLMAAVLDNLIVYGGYLLLCLVLHWRAAALNHLWVLLAAGVVYHFALEVRDGQTIGKRRYGLRVVSVDGGAADVRAVAFRSVLRVIDQLPVCYVSGLVNMVRTGPARRQRIGDVAGGTMVIAEGGVSVAKGTPGWYLPTATLLGVIASAFLIVGIVNAGNQPLTSAQQAEFITGCDNSAGAQVIDCSCLLNRLEGAGYNTLNSLQGVVLSAESEERDGTFGSARAAVAGAAQACRM
jgi:uncharacterized RDD family membrane protein YckC